MSKKVKIFIIVVVITIVMIAIIIMLNHVHGKMDREPSPLAGLVDVGYFNDIKDIFEFNDRFKKYNGSHKSITDVIEVYNEVIKSNETREWQISMKIYNTNVIGENIKLDEKNVMELLDKGKEYIVICEDMKNYGAIDTVTVTTEEIEKERIK